MKKPRLLALEKNVLKYRAFQMMLLIQEFESLKRYLLGSIRASDKIAGVPRIPSNAKKPLEIALSIMVADGFISEVEKAQVLGFGVHRNIVGHELYKLVADVSAPKGLEHPCVHDYWALDQLERLRKKIEGGLATKYVQQISMEDLVFEQAEITFKEELARLDVKITGQIAARLRPRERRRL